MKFAHFTTPDGSEVAVDIEGNAILRPAMAQNGDHPKAKTVIVMVCGTESVNETMAEVEEKLK